MEKIDTSPAALRALADDWNRNGYPVREEMSRALRAVADEKEAPAANQWRSIESAPKGGHSAGGTMVTDPDWTEPPCILLAFEGGEVAVGYWDWYYAPGGRGHANEEGGPWREPAGYSDLIGNFGPPTHWQPLQESPT